MVESGAARRCLLVGAGFSRAISRQMPLTDELGQQVLDDLRAEGLRGPAGGFEGGYFEAWLSRLAEPQPDLTDDANLHNQAWFSRITEQAWLVLSRRQRAVMAESPPAWLLRLIGLAHRTRATVVTFNYDTLLEAGFNTAFVYDWKQRSLATHWHLVGDLPPEPVRAGTFAREPAETFRLIKLHGSLDCWWVNGDASGATIMRSHGHPMFRHGEPVPLQDRPPGRTPFMVPPASAKSRFYGNPITRALWQHAAQVLGESAEVDLIGYSLPLTDLVTTGMLADRLGGRAVRVRVVNPSPNAPLTALRGLGVAADPFLDDMDAYVDDWEMAVGSGAWPELDALADELPVLVGSSPRNLRAVLRAGTGLVGEQTRSTFEATQSREAGDAVPVTVGDVRRLPLSGEPLVINDGTAERVVVGWELHATETGYRPQWAVALTAWSPPPVV